MSTIPPPEVRYVNSPRVACDGDEGPLGHPRVWLQIGEDGFVECGYCDRRFVLADGPADDRMPGPRTPGSGDIAERSADDRLAPGSTSPAERGMTPGGRHG